MTRRGSKPADPNANGLSLALLIEAQVKVVRHVGRFVADASDLTMKGVVSPAQWLQRYSAMWSDLAKDLGSLTKR